MSSEQQDKPVPTDPSLAPGGAPATEGGEDKGPSKSALKKAEAKAKKEAEKARKAAEREAAQAAQTSKASEDLAKENYGDLPKLYKRSHEVVRLEKLSKENVGKTVEIRGFLRNSRMQGAKMAFLELQKGDEKIQCVVAASQEGKPVSKQFVKWVGSVYLESTILVEATVQVPLEPVKSCSISEFELHVTKMYVAAWAPQTLPISIPTASSAVGGVDEGDELKVATEQLTVAEKDSGKVPVAHLSTLLDNPVLRMRAPVDKAIGDVRAMTKQLFRNYLIEQGFFEFESPCLIGASSEGGANVFQLPYFGKNAFLAQSPQFYKQFQIAGGRERVFCIGPVMRAENSNTPRHMTEFTGLDLEMEIEDTYHEVRDMLEAVLLHVFAGLEKNCSRQISLIRSIYPSEPFLLPPEGKPVRLSFAEAQELLRKEGPEEFRNVSDDEDMSTPQEKALGALVREKYKTDFLVLDKFPMDARPFYAMPDPENPKLSNAYDFMMRGQEILSGGQRIHLPEALEANIKAKGIDPSTLKDYVDIFRSAGVPPHGGGGIGLDRVVAWYLQLPSVHLACAYPRTPKRLTP